ncbi:transposase family protein [Streptomyces sp. NPDC096310]|uniref:helix-turn-helix domain-containing protein n=1 Tax=Streptomyces sp. NPDC096310 TaxID=3366082 RepID=UPI0037F80037
MGAGAEHKLVFVDRLPATLVHLRHGASHDVLACWFSVDRSTITRAIGAVRPLPAARHRLSRHRKTHRDHRRDRGPGAPPGRRA